jgi:hypothetical protein
MREHGVLNRILLIYEEGSRVVTRQDLPPEILSGLPGSLAGSSRSITRNWRKRTSSLGSRRPASSWIWSPFYASNTAGRR